MEIRGQELRKVYTKKLIEIAENDDRIVVLEADLGKASGTIPFRERFPDRFIDVGVAEANLMGIASGLAVMGMIPFAHSFTPFATRRAFDQITISIAYSKLNVKIGGTDPGVAAELNGGTHMSFEDAGIMRNLPGMIVVEPADSVQLLSLLPQIISVDSPVYMRLDRKNSRLLFPEKTEFTLGKIHKIRDGNDVTIICSGIMIENSIKAATLLENEGIYARVLNMHTLKPIDRETVVKAAMETGAIVTAENHSIINGWGSAVAEVLAEEYPVPMRRIGIRDHFGEVGKREFLLKKYKMTAEDIVKAAKEVILMKNNGNFWKRRVKNA